MCPNDLHPHVNGPGRPRRNNACRYCLKCTEVKGKLVLRVCPVVEVKRDKKHDARERREEKKLARRLEKERLHFTIQGHDLREEYARLLALPTCAPIRQNPPKLIVKWSKRTTGKWGLAKYREHEVLTYVKPRHATWQQHFETLAHELAHFVARGDKHGQKWKTAFRCLCEERWGFRPHINRRYDHELTTWLMEEKKAA